MAPSQHKAFINVDMGEGYGNYVCGPDEELLPMIDHANVACGFHAGDPLIMKQTVALCKAHNVKIGAHPGLPDIQGFGRREIKLSPEEHTANIIYQVGALQGFLAAEGVEMHHVKPHGVLYGMMLRDADVARAVWAGVPRGMRVFGLAGTHMETAALEAGLEFWAEYYGDVKYNADGTLKIDRKKQPWRIEDVKEHVRLQVEESRVKAVTGEVVDLPVKNYPVSVCCHSDSPGCVGIASAAQNDVLQLATLSFEQRTGATMSSRHGPTEQSSQTSTMMQEARVEGPGRLILATTITSVTCATFVGSINVGMLTIAIPSVAEDVGLDSSLLLWPQSISSLVCACTLLLFGSLADAFGSHRVYFLGIILQTAFTLGTALVRTSTQLLVCRALAGLAQAAILPSSVGLIVRTCPEGRMRNIAFASMGSGQPLGFSIGLVMAGGLIESLGWRSGFYVAAGINLFVCILALFSLAGPSRVAPIDWQSLNRSIDWVGTVVMTALLALVSYVLTIITAEGWTASYKANITMLCIAAALAPVFVWRQNRQVRFGRPALIPNSLWRQTKFSCICASVLLIWGAFNSFEQFMSLWFQLVDEVSVLDTSLRFLPQPVAGAAIGFSIGFLVHRVRANYIIIISTVVSTAAPLLMALASPKQSYWSAAFPALTLNAIGADCLYTVSNLIISSLFEPNMQGAAGGVFNTVAQVGKTLGLAIGTLIAGAVSSKMSEDLEESQRLVQGYQAAFWFCMALCGTSVVICSWGLRSVGKVGLKKD